MSLSMQASPHACSLPDSPDIADVAVLCCLFLTSKVALSNLFWHDVGFFYFAMHQGRGPIQLPRGLEL